MSKSSKPVLEVKPQDRSLQNRLLRTQDTKNRFDFRRDFVISRLMTRMEALFFQDLINLCNLRKAKSMGVEDGNGNIWDYFLFTQNYLRQSLLWDKNIQARLLKRLQDNGLLIVKLDVKPRRRWIWLNLVAAEEYIEKWLSKQERPSSSNRDDVQKYGSSSNRDDVQKYGSSSYRDDGSSSNRDVKKEDTTVSSNPSKRTTHCRRPASRAGDDVKAAPRNGRLIPEETTKGKSPSPSEWAECLVIKLYEAAASIHQTTDKTNTSTWGKELDLLAAEVKGGQDFVSEVLEFYIDNIDYFYAPEAYCGKSVRTKWLSIVAFRTRLQKQQAAKKEKKTTRQEEDENIW